MALCFAWLSFFTFSSFCKYSEATQVSLHLLFSFAFTEIRCVVETEYVAIKIISVIYDFFWLNPKKMTKCKTASDQFESFSL